MGSHRTDGLPYGYHRRLVLLHLRAVAGLLVAGTVMCMTVGTTLLLLLPLLPLLLPAAELAFYITYRRRKAVMDNINWPHEPRPYDGAMPFEVRYCWCATST